MKVNYKGSGQVYPGKISAVREMSPGIFLFDIAYDDTDTEDLVPAERIELIGGATSSSSPKAQTKAPQFSVGQPVCMLKLSSLTLVCLLWERCGKNWTQLFRLAAICFDNSRDTPFTACIPQMRFCCVP